MIELPKDSKWQLVHGMPVLGEGDVCVVVYSDGFYGHGNIFVAGVMTNQSVERTSRPFSPEHFAAGEKLLRDYLAKKREESVKEVFRSDWCTVFRREDGVEATVVYDGDTDLSWGIITAADGAGCEWKETRAEAESAARRALMEQ